VPRISVITTTRCRPDQLLRSVTSAQRAGTDVEVVVVDDASTDRTAEVCRALSGIRYVRSELNQGVAGARNIGILESTGDYLAFLDDDDERLPGSLDWQAEMLDRQPELGLVYGRTYVGDEECRPLPQPPHPVECPQGDVFWELLSRNVICVQSVLFRRSCLSRVGMMDAGISGVDDIDLWIRIAERYSVAAIEEPVATWRGSTPDSSQGSSRLDLLIKLVWRTHQRKWMRLPRALAASDAQRRAINQAFRDSLSDVLLCTALSMLPEGHRLYAQRAPCASTEPEAGAAASHAATPRRLLRTAPGAARIQPRGSGQVHRSSGRGVAATIPLEVRRSVSSPGVVATSGP
jgi:hypothetical protein